MCTLPCVVSVHLPTGAASNSDRSLLNDGAFDAFLKQVEKMHTQGKGSFEAEFDVSGNLVQLVCIHMLLINALCVPHLTQTLTLTQSIEKATASSTTVAELNNVKNRYKNIFPCEHS